MKELIKEKQEFINELTDEIEQLDSLFDYACESNYWVVLLQDYLEKEFSSGGLYGFYNLYKRGEFLINHRVAMLKRAGHKVTVGLDHILVDEDEETGEVLRFRVSGGYRCWKYTELRKENKNLENIEVIRNAYDEALADSTFADREEAALNAADNAALGLICEAAGITTIRGITPEARQAATDLRILAIGE